MCGAEGGAVGCVDVGARGGGLEAGEAGGAAVGGHFLGIKVVGREEGMWCASGRSKLVKATCCESTLLLFQIEWSFMHLLSEVVRFASWRIADGRLSAYDYCQCR